MPSRPWFKWYPGDYLADTYALSWDADLLYRRMLDALWIYETLPRSPGDLSKILRTDRRKISRLLPELLPYFSETSGRLHHPKMTAQWTQATETSAKRRAAAGKRWHASADANISAPKHASAYNAHDPRARPDPEDQDLNNRVPGSGLNPPARPPAPAREAKSGGFTAEQQAYREQLQADLEARRAAEGVAPPAPLRSVGTVASGALAWAAPDPEPEPEGNPESNPEPGNPEDF